MATIYCTLLGKKGIREVAVQNVAKTQYALSELKKVASLKMIYPGPRFNELVIQLPIPYENVAAKFTSAKIIPGLPLKRYYPALKDCLLLSFTETKSKTDIDRLIQLLSLVA
jgi:glycine cleavage system P protein (glycine dehydrogenase) subunit 1